jgi:hypothetical protein
MAQPHLSTYLRLRLVVGYLGEQSQFGWWQTSFLAPASKPFLEPVFPRSIRLAQYQGIVEAAKRVHDEHIGVGHVFHLFRLPEETEQDLHSLLLESLGDSKTLPSLQSKEEALEVLARMSGGSRPEAEGPIAMGKIEDLVSERAQEALAGTYLAAFEAGGRAYPYFVSPDGDQAGTVHRP